MLDPTSTERLEVLAGDLIDAVCDLRASLSAGNLEEASTQALAIEHIAHDFDARRSVRPRRMGVSAGVVRRGARGREAGNVSRTENWREMEFAMRPEVQLFACEMERQLRANDHKGGWTADTPHALLDRLREEADELEAVLNKLTRDGTLPLAGSMTSPIWWEVVQEAADVANFAMMIADLATRSGVHGLKGLHEIRERLAA